jgi:hypothetical protein
MRRALGFKLQPTGRVFYFIKGAEMSFVFSKQPGETYPVAFDFSAPGALPDSVTISSAVATAYDAKTGATAAGVLSGSASTTTTRATQRVTGGTDGKDYHIKFLITLSDSSVLEEDLIMEVRESGR